MKTHLVIAFLSSVLFLGCSDGSPVWRIEGNGSVIYLGGTIHVLNESDYPLPAAFDSAYQNSESVVLETDLSTLEDPDALQQLVWLSMYHDGRILKDVLSAETFEAVKQAFIAADLELDDSTRFKPGFISLTLTGQKFAELGLEYTSGVDYHFYNLASSDNKDVYHFESPEEQIQIIAELGSGYEDEFLRQTMNDLDTIEEGMGEMIASWRVGGVGFIEEMCLEMRDEFPEMYKNFVVDRNQAMYQQIETLLASQQTEFVLVGTLHVIGEDGLLAILEDVGYSVQQLMNPR